MSDRSDRFTAVLDTNVLGGGLTRNVLLSLAETGFYRPRWSCHILDEFERYFIKRFEDESDAKRQRKNIETAFPEGLVENYESIIEILTLPDPDDRHVLACAIQTKAAVIVTENLKDFPQDTLASHDIQAVALDGFIADTIDLAGAEAVAALRNMRLRFEDPKIDAEDLILRFERVGLIQSAKLLQPFQDLL